jgi:hypothetical protein
MIHGPVRIISVLYQMYQWCQCIGTMLCCLRYCRLITFGGSLLSARELCVSYSAKLYFILVDVLHSVLFSYTFIFVTLFHIYCRRIHTMITSLVRGHLASQVSLPRTDGPNAIPPLL